VLWLFDCSFVGVCVSGSCHLFISWYFSFFVPPPPASPSASALLNHFTRLTGRDHDPTATEFETLLQDIKECISGMGLGDEVKQIFSKMRAQTVRSLNTEQIVNFDKRAREIGNGGDAKSSSVAAFLPRDGLPIELPTHTKSFSGLRVLSSGQAKKMTGFAVDTTDVKVPKVAALCFAASQQLIVLLGAEKLSTLHLFSETDQNTPLRVTASMVRLDESTIQLILHRGLQALAKSFGLSIYDGRAGPAIALRDSDLCRDKKQSVPGVGLTDCFVCLDKSIRALIEIKVHFDSGSHLSQMLASLLGLAAGVNNKLLPGEKTWSSRKVGAPGAVQLSGLLFNGFQLIAAQTAGHDMFHVSSLVKENLAEALYVLFQKIAKGECLKGPDSIINAADMGDNDDGIFDFTDESHDPDEGQEGQDDKQGSTQGGKQEKNQVASSGDENTDAGCGSSSQLGSLTHVDLILHEMELNKGNFWRSLLGRDVSKAQNFKQPLHQRHVNYTP
jgi:hypothetical protein